MLGCSVSTENRKSIRALPTDRRSVKNLAFLLLDSMFKTIYRTYGIFRSLFLRQNNAFFPFIFLYFPQMENKCLYKEKRFFNPLDNGSTVLTKSEDLSGEDSLESFNPLDNGAFSEIL